jgi:hypothetical protein
MRTEVYDILDCYHVCTETLQHCLKMGGKHAAPAHINTLMDTATICAAMVDFVMRSSVRSKMLAPLCIEICEACATSCEAMNTDSEMQRCIDACKACIETCEDMIK